MLGTSLDLGYIRVGVEHVAAVVDAWNISLTTWQRYADTAVTTTTTTAATTINVVGIATTPMVKDNAFGMAGGVRGNHVSSLATAAKLESVPFQLPLQILFYIYFNKST